MDPPGWERRAGKAFALTAKLCRIAGSGKLNAMEAVKPVLRRGVIEGSDTIFLSSS